MIKAYVITIDELDDAEYAYKQFEKQLKAQGALLTNTIGILSCHADFLQSPVLPRIVESLPFQVVGTTTVLNGVNAGGDYYYLSLQILTSDDVEFKIEKTEELFVDNFEKEIAKTVTKILRESPEQPKLFLAYSPLKNDISCDSIIYEIDKTTKGDIPIFGLAAVDHTPHYEFSQTILGSTGYRNSLILVSLTGNVHPRFTIASVKEENIKKEKAIITKSYRNLLQEVNGLPVVTYLESIGLSKEDVQSGLGVIPFIVNYDSKLELAARAVFGLTPENWAICGGEVPVNTVLSIGNISQNDVIETSLKVVKEALKEKPQVMLLYSCMARYLVQIYDNKEEFNSLKKEIGNQVNFLFSYSGGEICPVIREDGKLINHIHNYSLVILSL
ncbi:MAG: FIST C-terminal domain-containing protein [Bacillales bacterium]|jgi:hypothetical protein|nr:FIST C-terminal domain-containing protein [Bacillales bacterium]